MPRSPKPTIRKSNRQGDIKKDLSINQLAGIGAVATAFTEAEYIIDAMIFHAISIPRDLGLTITTRINGIDGKVEITLQLCREFLKFPDAAYDTLHQTLIGFKEYKRFRDQVVHAHIIDADAAIGLRIGRRAKMSNILLTEGFLDGLYERLVLIKKELDRLLQVINVMGVRARVDPDYLGDIRTGLVGQNLQEFLAQAQEHQNQRLSLPKLPELPYLPQVPES